MHLTPHEEDRLLVAAAADLARRRLARGARLGATEAAALISDEVYEWAWDGVALEEVIERAHHVLTADQVHETVPEMLDKLQIDALFPAGTYLVDVVAPIASSHESAAAAGPPLELNVGHARREMTATNHASRTIRVTSHVDISQVNPMLRIEDGPITGWRLDIPAGSNVAWEPGETKTVALVRWNASEEGARA